MFCKNWIQLHKTFIKLQLEYYIIKKTLILDKKRV